MRIEADPIPPSPFFQEHLKRLQQHFDLESTEESKKLLIDAIASEALEGIERIKLWKSAPLEGETTCGVADLFRRRAEAISRSALALHH